MKRHTLDSRRTLTFPGNSEQTLRYAVEHWVETANSAIEARGSFCVALSGGSTPKKIFQLLASTYKERVEWSRVALFWSDERSVPPSSADSNYHMAMEEAGLSQLPIPKEHIFRMQAEEQIEANALVYEKTIQEHLPDSRFDLIMLGMGDDGHTASLFPHTAALTEQERLVVANHVPQKETQRMTFTYPLINKARAIALYVLGEKKREILKNVLLSPLDTSTYPSQGVGSENTQAEWIIDEAAGQNLVASLK